MYNKTLLNSFKRQFSSIKFFETKKVADEAKYFKKEEEELLRKLLDKNPEIKLKHKSDLDNETGSLAQDISLVLSKYNFNNVNGQLINDLISVFTCNGYKKSN
ncbi:conserved Plasmodium protein, unknown function [Babesia microti strain RI]|uniref:Uncharacterized protein n=1 Tax=Babesia microti (strain RI) TaxID=1133968 RepID=A0A1N6LXK4_BABMR|nr:conserved Plasmodium protein, unknown function [Babesia microti strain RI]SIO73593.1 conserved Plasmodium protein, unknown function [Babesia microti strain RI]|eukprot:XP_021337678.1 conserved Plasmodium protein, unknown function [Babesia microti strain RI]